MMAPSRPGAGNLEAAGRKFINWPATPTGGPRGMELRNDADEYED